MIKTSVIIAALTVIAANIMAQDDGNSAKKLQFGFKIGANLANVYDSQDEGFNTNPKLGLAAGSFLSVPIGRFFGVQGEVMFSQKGYQNSGTVLGVDYTYQYTSNFIDIPLMIAIQPIPALTLLAGPQYSFLLSEKRKFTNTLFDDPIVREEDFENTNVRKNTLGFIVGGDINIDRIVFGLRAGFDILNNNGDGTQTTPRYKNAYYQATVGFRF